MKRTFGLMSAILVLLAFSGCTHNDKAAAAAPGPQKTTPTTPTTTTPDVTTGWSLNMLRGCGT